jgi:hypothetical protein
MLRCAASCGVFIAIVVMGSAQHPGVSVSADLYTTVTYNEKGKTVFRLWDDKGNFSRVRFSILLDNGWNIRFFQRLARIDNDSDSSGIEQFYVERPGHWRIGKQQIPFGSEEMENETALGLRYDTELAFGSIPISVAIVDNGSMHQRGGVARVGGDVGVSYARGEHFGIAPSAFTQVRQPETAPGKSRGYKEMVGVDAKWSNAGFTLSLEWVGLRRGHTNNDPEEDVVNVGIAYQFPYGPEVEMEFARALRASRSSVRLQTIVPISRKFFWVPYVRWYEDGDWLFSLSARLRL